MKLSFSLSVLCVSGVLAQYADVSSSVPPSATQTSGSAPLTTTIDVSVEDLWNLFVGPVEVAGTTTTVSPTPVPSSELIPPPPLYYSPFPSGHQQPTIAKNESWSFPKDFWWGVASAAYQSEGAVKDEGRGPSIWDVLTHRVPAFVAGNVTGDVTDNHYYLYKQDIARIAAMGVPYYSFSIRRLTISSWSRILPYGRGRVNEAGLAHYDDVINTCLQYNITPVVTLYHWDLPLYLQNLYGGWLSEEIVDDFVEYARIIFARYGDRVQHWFTINEPLVFCSSYPLPTGYFKATSIPPKQQPFYCAQSVLLAHSQAYRLGKSMGLSGTISMKQNGGYKIPLTNSSDDQIAVQRAWDFNEGLYSNPTFLGGDYPSYVKEYTSTFLRNFTDAEKAGINGSVDIYAHDGYTSQFYSAPEGGFEKCLANPNDPLFPSCVNSAYAYSQADGGWNVGYAADPGSPWLHKATDWVPALLHYIHDTWKPTAIAITEFGFAEPFESLKQLQTDIRLDYVRTGYYRDYMQAILIALSEGVPVVGSVAWSILDNLEWNQGFNSRFGLQYVNFTTQERAYKSSFFEYVNVFKRYQES